MYRDSVRTQYRYRPDGLRYSKTTNDNTAVSTTVHHWNGSSIVLETGGNGAVKSRFLRGAGLICQQIDDSMFYYLFNAHGDVVQRVCGDKNAAPMYEYDAFGNQKTPVKTDPNPFRYCGEYFDEETGEIYLRNRSYESRSGRFTQEDPAQDGLNWYTYCGNNPIAFVDPSGLSLINLALSIINVASSVAKTVSSAKSTSSSSSKSGSSSSSSPSKSTTTTYSAPNQYSTNAKSNVGSATYAGAAATPFLPAIGKALADTFMALGALISGVWTIQKATESKGEAKDKTTEKSKDVPVPDKGYEHDPTENNGHNLDTTGKPNSYQDLYGQDGELKQRRYYGPDGKAKKDTDFNHPGDKHTFPHDHNWDWSGGFPRRY